MPDQLPHLFVEGFTESRNFKSLLRGDKAKPPERERVPHGARLLRQLQRLGDQQDRLKQQRQALGFEPNVGMTLAIEVRPHGILDAHKQLEWKREGIEVLSIIESLEADIIAVHVPEGSLSAFEKRIQDYLTKTAPQSDKPKNAALVCAIEDFRQAAFDELWTDPTAEPPSEDEVAWFQVWLRCPRDIPATQVRDRFAHGAQPLNIVVEPGYVPFPGRIVIAARATKRALQQALDLLDMIAEIRGVDPTAEFFLSDLAPRQQADWMRDLLERTDFSAGGDDKIYVTLLDTGVNRAHPLIAPALAPDDMHAVDAAWLTSDHHGHGTQMAGLTIHGDLTIPMAFGQGNPVPHRLESVKILPPVGANPQHLYGFVTQRAAEVVEAAGVRRRVFATMTTSVGKQTGMPSEWSATLDRLAFGYTPMAQEAQSDALTPRLFVLSAGNVPWPEWSDYPNSNNTRTIENPGQAWNALTVGAYTQHVKVDAAKWPGLTPIADMGSMAPASTTSLMWSRAWPYKPDVVAEGGNGSFDRGRNVAVGPESLRLLTTGHDVHAVPLVETGDTSAAAAEVARLCAHLGSTYPAYWPETIRALVVHGASYTKSMRSTLPLVHTVRQKENLVRRFGYGAVSAQSSLFSDRSRPTLVIQQTISPYKLDGGISLNQLNMHELPWPTQVLQDLGAAEVGLRVTLSYFVEPNPSQRGWQSKYRYQSHGLRFAVRAATESEDEFGQRINKLEREASQDAPQHMNDPDSGGWFLGFAMRSKGSIHSDYWQGNAAKLASKSHIAVFPVGGWWKDWRDCERHDWVVRYSLVVTLEVLGDTVADLYTPIANAIAVEVPGA